MGPVHKPHIAVGSEVQAAKPLGSIGSVTVVVNAALALVGLTWQGFEDQLIAFLGWPPGRTDLLIVVLGMGVIAASYVSLRLRRVQGTAVSDPDDHGRLAEIDDGILFGDFVPYFNPIRDVATGRIVAAEVVVRWIGPEGRVRLPDEFVPFMESSGRLHRITGRMIAAAAAAVRFSKDLGREIRVSVNVAAGDFQHLDLVREVEEACRREGIAVDRIGVEVAESVAMRRNDLAQAVAVALNARGVSIALDGFGAGGASMRVIESLPFSQIKLDRAVVEGLLSDPVAQAIAGCAVALAETLGAEVVANGVEDVVTVARLRDIGIGLMQGSDGAGAMTLSDLVLHLTDGRPRPAVAPGGRVVTLGRVGAG